MSDNERQSLTARKKPKIPCFVLTIDILSLFTVASLVAVVVAQVLSFFNKDLHLIDHVIGFYVILICLPGALVQLGKFPVLKTSLISTHWTVRGFLYVFIGTLVLQNHEKDKFGKDAGNSIILFAASTIIFAGGVYFVLGLFCAKKLYDGKLDHYKEAIAEFKVRTCPIFN
jgi:hypothetical protein